MDEVMNKELTTIHLLSILNMAEEAKDLDHFVKKYRQMLQAAGICIPDKDEEVSES